MTLKYWLTFIILLIKLVFNDSVDLSLPSKSSHACEHGEALLYTLTSPQAKCIDGSPYTFNFRKSKINSKKWIVFMDGGAWCYTIEDCIDRGNTFLGSSKHDNPPCLSRDRLHNHMNIDQTVNPYMHDWNVVVMRYCDGSSFTSNTEVIHKDGTLYFHGMINRDETVRAVLALGMNNATDVVISGCSAGGLAVYLGIDQMTNLIHTVNPTAKVRGLAISGYFPDYHNPEHQTTRNYNLQEYPSPGKSYRYAMEETFEWMNISAGTHPDCVHAYTHKHHKIWLPVSNTNTNKATATVLASSACFFAGHVAPYIRTPIFSIQSKHDSWQLNYILKPDVNDITINTYGDTLRQDMIQALHPSHSQQERNVVNHGTFIYSCYEHGLGCRNAWSGTEIVAKRGISTTPTTNSTEMFLSPAKAFALWYASADHHHHSHNNNNNNQSMTRLGEIWLQDEPFPCQHCCACHKV